MIKKITNCTLLLNSFLFAALLSFGFSQECDNGFAWFAELPETATVTAGDSCLSNIDLDALDDLATENELEVSGPIEVGIQTWSNNRLSGLVASYNPNGIGVTTQLEVLPESFGNISNLSFLYLKWNRLTSLPISFGQLTNLITLELNNNWLTSLPEDIGNLSNMIFLDLGYNFITSVPESLCNMENLIYLYLFDNELNSIPQCICNIDMDWNGFDGGGYPFFGIGGNNLCEDIPDCVENSSNFELSLEQFYYSIPIEAPQDCPDCENLGDLNGDAGWNVLDIVTLANCILLNNCLDLENGCAGDLNSDGFYNVLDIVTLANCILSQNCGG